MRSPDTLDALDGLVRLSNRVGQDLALVQPGGGNSSIKVEVPDSTGNPIRTLLVKGSGTDMRTIGRAGFSQLSLERLGALRGVERMSDREMMRFMADCATGDGPAPSVETPLHSILPHRVIVHTHDVLTMSLTNLKEELARRLVEEVFEGQVVYVPYARPGFPLARLVDQMVDGIPADAKGLALAHHGLVVWGDDALAVQKLVDWARQKWTGRRNEQGAGGRGRAGQGAHAVVVPALRGALSGSERVITHLDDSDEALEAIASVTPEQVARGVGTPEHILRAGRRPVWIELDPRALPAAQAESVHAQVTAQYEEYLSYHRQFAPPGEAPIGDWAKVALIPGLGIVTAFKDRKGAVTANLCYKASLAAMREADRLGGFEFISDTDVFEFEHWPLERRKIEEEIVRERETMPLARQVAVIIGGGSGIGEAAAMRFAEAGAHVVVADLAVAEADRVAVAVGKQFPGKAVSTAVDVRSDESIAQLFEKAVREFGGVDCLFYTAGSAPRFAPITELTREDLERQVAVHYTGAVLAMGAAARVMKLQRRGGSIVLSISKAAMVPGRDAAAYGGSKAALLQAMRVAAVELGPDQIRVNAINADQVDTPLFRRFVEERAAMRGVTPAEQLEAYRQRNLMGVSLIPAAAVADLAVLLASDKFRYTTGDILTVDGGLAEGFPR